jgi:Protein tyrosine and serine/threonine kinase
MSFLTEQVAIKRLDRRGMQGDKEFGMEASMLCSLKHVNIVTLRGVCVEGDNRCTIFDLAANVRLPQPSEILIMSPGKLCRDSINHHVQPADPEAALHHLTPNRKCGFCRARCGRSWT